MAKKKHSDGEQINGILLRNGRWYARARVNGKEVWRSAGPRGTADDAQKLLVRLRADAHAERMGEPRPSDEALTIARFFDAFYLPHAKHEKSSAWRDEAAFKHLRPALGHLRLAGVRVEHVEGYQKTRAADGASGRTINIEVATLRRILHRAVEIGRLTRSPLDRAKITPRKEAIREPAMTPAQEAALLAAFSRNDAMQWAVRLALLSGMRQGELLACKWAAFNATTRTITVNQAWERKRKGEAPRLKAPKNGKSRTFKVPTLLAAELVARREALMQACGVTDPGDVANEFIVQKADGGPMDLTTFGKNFRRGVEKAGLNAPRKPPTPEQAARGEPGDPVDEKELWPCNVPTLHFHDLRHCFGEKLLSAGAAPQEAADFLGHKDLRMVLRYCRSNPRRQEELTDRMTIGMDPAEPETPDRHRLRKVAGGEVE